MAEPFYGSTPIGGIARRLLRISMLFLNLFILRSKKKTVEIPAVPCREGRPAFAIHGFSRAISLLHVAIKRLKQRRSSMTKKLVITEQTDTRIILVVAGTISTRTNLKTDRKGRASPARPIFHKPVSRLLWCRRPIKMSPSANLNGARVIIQWSGAAFSSSVVVVGRRSTSCGGARCFWWKFMDRG